MIKNKTSNIKTTLKIFKKIKNILNFQTYFYSTNYRRTIFINYFSELFFKTITKHVWGVWQILENTSNSFKIHL